MNLWLARHALPCIDAGVCYGALDMPAQPLATRQAAQALALVLPQGLTVWTSPLQRCELLAHCLWALRPDLICKTDVRLKEMDFGEWEGVAWAQVPRAAVDAWLADFGDHRFGGAESANEVLARVAAAWADAQQATQRATQSGGQDALWITHAGVIRAASLVAQGVQRITAASQWPLQAPAYGQWRLLQQALRP